MLRAYYAQLWPMLIPTLLIKHHVRSLLRINSTRDVWKFCQNWTNCQLYEQHRMHDYLYLLLALQNWILLNVNIVNSLANAQFCQTFNQNLVILFVFSFTLLLKQNLVLLFIFSSSSRAISNTNVF
jgi:hypothetical protein